MSCVFGDRGEADWVYMGPVEEAIPDPDSDMTETDEIPKEYKNIRLGRPCLESSYGPLPKTLRANSYQFKGTIYDIPKVGFDDIIPGKLVGCACCHPEAASMTTLMTTLRVCPNIRCSRCVCYIDNKEALESYLQCVGISKK